MLRNDDIYEEILRNHAFYSKNYLNKISNVTHCAEGTNLACGDKIIVNICNKNNIIYDINFEGICCEVSKSSASLMTDELKGKTMEEAKILFTKVNKIVLSQEHSDDFFHMLIKRLSCMPSEKKHHKTIKCALLPWKTMLKAIKSISRPSKLKKDFTLFLE